MRKALVTGSAGFVGTHLVTQLMADGWDVEHFNLRDGLDLRDKTTVRDTLDIYRPDAIFHLGARAYVPESFVDPAETFHVNLIGTLNILESVRQLGLQTKIHIAGSSEEYGTADPKEYGYLHPSSPYAVSKVAADQLANVYMKAYGMHVVVTRAFNHTGPGRGEMYAESSFAKQIAEIEKGTRTVLEHGNLDAVRNYTDVRDVVKAYILAVDAPSGVYNICSSLNISMGDMLTMLTSMSDKPITTVSSSKRKRPNDFSFIKPYCSDFSSVVGWYPEIPFEQTLKDLLNYWKERV